MVNSPTDFDKLRMALEPAATKGESEWPNVGLLSMAVSLKRIADTLSATTVQVDFNQRAWRVCK